MLTRTFGGYSNFCLTKEPAHLHWQAPERYPPKDLLPSHASSVMVDLLPNKASNPSKFSCRPSQTGTSVSFLFSCLVMQSVSIFKMACSCLRNIYNERERVTFYPKKLNLLSKKRGNFAWIYALPFTIPMCG